MTDYNTLVISLSVVIIFICFFISVFKFLTYDKEMKRKKVDNKVKHAVDSTIKQYDKIIEDNIEIWKEKEKEYSNAFDELAKENRELIEEIIAIKEQERSNDSVDGKFEIIVEEE